MHLFPILPNKEPKDPPDSIILYIWALPSFISVGILLSTCISYFSCLSVVRNNSCSNSSSSKFFLFNLNTVPVLFFLP